MVAASGTISLIIAVCYALAVRYLTVPAKIERPNRVIEPKTEPLAAPTVPGWALLCTQLFVASIAEAAVDNRRLIHTAEFIIVLLSK